MATLPTRKIPLQIRLGLDVGAALPASLVRCADCPPTGRVRTVERAMFPCPSIGRAIDAYAQDDIMHLGGVRVAEGLANHAWDPRPSGQRRARDGLRVACASPLSCGSQRPSVVSR